MDHTIAAISTAMNRSGIGIIRISGNDAIPILKKIFRSPDKRKDISASASHTVHYGYIYDEDTMIDEVLVLIMKAPHSYTREDVVEIDCHGGIISVKKILQVILSSGAVLAEPGEFTKRAFLNGRIDLSQAEAVMDLIMAKNETAMEYSLSQLNGKLRSRMEELRGSILTETAFIEVAIDDPEHYVLVNYPEELRKKVGSWIHVIRKWIDSYDDGKLIQEGIRTVILGKPNAGKSSLLNLILGEERAIVTEIAGTTRDTLEEDVNIGQITLRLIDTAGIRKTNDIVETMGVQKAYEKADQADLILYVVDSSVGLDENDKKIFDLLYDKKAIILYNKSDLPSQTGWDEVMEAAAGKTVIRFSVKEGLGIEELNREINSMFFLGTLSQREDLVINNIRHKTALESALGSLSMVMQSIESMLPEDFFSIDLMDAYQSLGSIMGEEVGEDLVNEIFSRFCMGK